MNSDEARAAAVDAVVEAAGCSVLQARAVVHSIAAYVSRFHDEVVNHRGPAWAFVQQMEAADAAEAGA